MTLGIPVAFCRVSYKIAAKSSCDWLADLRMDVGCPVCIACHWFALHDRSILNYLHYGHCQLLIIVFYCSRYDLDNIFCLSLPLSFLCFFYGLGFKPIWWRHWWWQMDWIRFGRRHSFVLGGGSYWQPVCRDIFSQLLVACLLFALPELPQCRGVDSCFFHACISDELRCILPLLWSLWQMKSTSRPSSIVCVNMMKSEVGWWVLCVSRYVCCWCCWPILLCFALCLYLDHCFPKGYILRRKSRGGVNKLIILYNFIWFIFRNFNMYDQNWYIFAWKAMIDLFFIISYVNFLRPQSVH